MFAAVIHRPVDRFIKVRESHDSLTFGQIGGHHVHSRFGAGIGRLNDSLGLRGPEPSA
jgi:hypothetical protein